MSIENVNQFYQVASRDPDLQLQFQCAADEESLVKMAVEVGQQHGYSFTAEEVIQAIALAHPPTEATGIVELADEQLEAVAGGKPSAADVGNTIVKVASFIPTPIGLGILAAKGAAVGIAGLATKAAGLPQGTQEEVVHNVADKLFDGPFGK